MGALLALFAILCAPVGTRGRDSTVVLLRSSVRARPSLRRPDRPIWARRGLQRRRPCSRQLRALDRHMEDVTRFVDGGATITAIALPAIRDDLVV